MKKSHFFIHFAVALLVILCISCRSAPDSPQPAPVAPSTPAEPSMPEPAQPATPQPAAPQPTQGVQQGLPNELNAAITRAEEARRLAEDFEGPAYFPSDWEAAEEHFAQAGRSPRDSESAISTAIHTYNTAAASYESIARMAIPLYAQAREDEIMDLRNSLVMQGARISFSDFLHPADEAAILALSQYEAEDYYTARDSALSARHMFEILTIALRAWQVKLEIDDRDFELYDPDNYDRAGEIVSNAMDAYRAGNLAVGQRDAEEALLRYNLVLSTGWAGYAEIRSQLAESERQAALDMRTNISARELFNMADSDNSEGQILLEAEHYEEAARAFGNAEAMFIIASMAAMERRHAAAAALREAQNRIEASDRTAVEAEAIIEGGSQ